MDVDSKLARVMDVASVDMDAARTLLEASGWDVGKAVELALGTAVGAEASDDGEAHRAPIDARSLQLIDDGDRIMRLQRGYQPVVSVFHSVPGGGQPSRRRGGAGGASAARSPPRVADAGRRGGSDDHDDRKSLLDTIFEPPADVICHKPFTEACEEARSKHRWLVAYIIDPIEFASARMIRDTWRNESVKELIKTFATLYMQERSTGDALEVVARYRLSHPFPITLFIDPRTGQCVRQLNGDVSAEDMRAQLTDLVHSDLSVIQTAPQPPAAALARMAAMLPSSSSSSSSSSFAAAAMSRSDDRGRAESDAKRPRRSDIARRLDDDDDNDNDDDGSQGRHHIGTSGADDAAGDAELQAAIRASLREVPAEAGVATVEEGSADVFVFDDADMGGSSQPGTIDEDEASLAIDSSSDDGGDAAGGGGGGRAFPTVPSVADRTLRQGLPIPESFVPTSTSAEPSDASAAGLEVTRVMLRLPDGKRLVRHVLRSDPVSLLFHVVAHALALPHPLAAIHEARRRLTAGQLPEGTTWDDVTRVLRVTGDVRGAFDITVIRPPKSLSDADVAHDGTVASVGIANAALAVTLTR